MRRKNFILARQPHEVISPKRSFAWSPLCVALLLLVGLLSPMTTPDAHLNAVRKGLERVALGKQICPLMPQSDAVMLLKEWFGAKKVCSEPTEAMWQAYCQQFYVSEGGDCSGTSPETKALIMENMRVCRVI